ncbi:WecB/TagA/CpsF family glycosyltransferase [Leeuwenhoekiella marinoflava]|uniref:WecB/TagA/CpsF family glycosyltransferase n=1 Tax=Leeuwenhoekiella marinoflava TaxID=988 RepID=UPI00300317DB
MKSSLNYVSLFDYKLYSKSLDQIDFSKKSLITTINQYSYCVAQKDSVFKTTLKESDILLPDGVGIVIAALMRGQKIKKIAGAEIHHHLLERLNKVNGSCFYMGSSEATLGKIKERITREYPNIRVATYSPPFKDEFSDIDNLQIIDTVNNFEPDVLFVGMTAPKQEKWAFENKSLLNTKTICAIGAVFDFYAGTVKRPSDFWIKLKLEWFIRLIKEPKRMWKRYLYYGPVFIFSILPFPHSITKLKVKH